MGPEERLQHVVRRLRDEGHRLTPQRGAILQVLMSSDSHPTAQDIHRQVSAEFPMISLATVYKTLNMLKDMGEVRELIVEGQSHYEGDVSSHAHLICRRCHAILDQPLESMDRIRKEVMSETGFGDLHCEVEVHGLCPRCMGEDEAS